MKQADVPVVLELRQEGQQGAGAFGKVERIHPLVLGFRGAATDHVADVDLGQFVLGQVGDGVAARLELGDQGRALGRPVELHAYEDAGLGAGRVAVIEFGDLAPTQRGAKRLEGAGAFGDGDGQHGLALLADLGPLGDVAQAVEVHVGAAGQGHQRLTVQAVRSGIFLESGHRERPGGLHDGAGVVEDVLDGGADLVGADRNPVVDELARQLEGVLTDLLDRHAVHEQAHGIQPDALPGPHAAGHGVGVVGLHAHDPDIRAQRFQEGRHARDQPAAAHRHEDGVVLAGKLRQQLQAHRALPGDHVGVVVGMHEGHAALLLKQVGVGLGVAERVAVEHDLGAALAAGPDLDLGGGRGHHDQSVQPQLLGAEGHALRVVARRGGDDAAFPLRLAQARHLVVGAAQLEGKHRLLVLALEQHRVAQALRELRRVLKGGFDGHVVHAAGQHPAHQVHAGRSGDLRFSQGGFGLGNFGHGASPWIPGRQENTPRHGGGGSWGAVQQSAPDHPEAGIIRAVMGRV